MISKELKEQFLAIYEAKLMSKTNNTAIIKTATGKFIDLLNPFSIDY